MTNTALPSIDSAIRREIDALIRDELGRAAELPMPDADPTWRERANQLFLELVNT